MSGPRHIGNIGKWRLLRWEYDGAPLIAEHPRMGGSSRHQPLSAGDWTVEIDDDGDLVFDGLEGVEPCVPGEVLRELAINAIARGVWNR